MNQHDAGVLREWKVAVFEHPRKRSTGLMAYTRWYNPDWPDCCLHTVMAWSGASAKQTACAEHRSRCMTPIVSEVKATP